jgi:hypothetical protein
VDDSGAPVPQARVFVAQAPSPAAHQVAGLPLMTGPQMLKVTADANGQFAAGNLPAGEYVACAQSPKPGLLDPCHWSTSAPKFTIAAGAITQGVRVIMAKGAVIPIHLADPQQLLKPAANATPLDCQIHLVTAKGMRYLAAIVAATATGRDHAVTVPFGTPFQLQVVSPHLTVNDATGAPAIAPGAVITATSASAIATVNYTVAGVRP